MQMDPGAHGGLGPAHSPAVVILCHMCSPLRPAGDRSCLLEVETAEPQVSGVCSLTRKGSSCSPLSPGRLLAGQPASSSSWGSWPTIPA